LSLQEKENEVSQLKEISLEFEQNKSALSLNSRADESSFKTEKYGSSKKK